ncbi:carbohydrate kinase [Cohaesibacter celericrescens]|uniref:Carbohydrate kinase n=2 Tax=Cohaesibacter celericrescens TaxID=2067669 RepID=A0A2N5XR98_9HYPH|nr:carbohydrate kinase [Cohaesibacter celericrescens]
MGVLCVGRIYCDLIFQDVPRLPTMGTEVFTGGLELNAGGGAYISAAYLKSLGRPAFLASMIPNQPFRDIVQQQIEAADLDASLCAASDPALDPQVTVALINQATQSEPSDRAFITRRVGPALPRLTQEQLTERNIGHLHIGELATLIEQPYLLDLAKQAGLTISLDCSWDDSITIAAASLISRVDLFLPNQSEAQRLESLGVEMASKPIWVVKCGADGAFVKTESGVIHCPAIKTQPVDTTGAGDAFNSGFLNQWLAGADTLACLQAGIACGTIAVQSKGGFTPESSKAS